MTTEHDALSFLDSSQLNELERERVAQVIGAPDPAPQPAAKEVEGVETMVDDGKGHSVPLATYLDERRRRERVEDELDGLKKAAPAADEFDLSGIVVPDPATDAAGYARYQTGLINFAVLNERMNNSERWSRKEHGDEDTDKMLAWITTRFKADPAYEERIMQERDPYEQGMKDYKAGLKLAELPDDATFAEYKAWKEAKDAAGKVEDGQEKSPAAEGGGQPRNETTGQFVVQPAQQPASKTPPRSIASAPSGGGNAHTVASGPGQAFDNVIP